MSPIRPDLPTPRQAATHPVSATAARVAQAAFFQQALSAVKSAQAAAREDPGPGPAEAPEPPRRPGALLDILV